MTWSSAMWSWWSRLPRSALRDVHSRTVTEKPWKAHLPDPVRSNLTLCRRPRGQSLVMLSEVPPGPSPVVCFECQKRSKLS